MECKKLFCKTNLKLKVLKLIKTQFNAKPWRHKIENIRFCYSIVEIQQVIHTRPLWLTGYTVLIRT